MSTKDTLNDLVQRVGLNKAVKLLGVKGVGKATYQKIASGEIKPSRSVVGRASHASRLAEQQIQFQHNKELAKRLGYDKVQKRTGEKMPTSKSSLKELEAFNRRFTNRKLSPPSVHRLTGIRQETFTRAMKKQFVKPESVRYEGRQIVAETTHGNKAILVYLSVPKIIRGKKVVVNEWYFTAQENIDAYNKFKEGEAEALYQVWTYDDVELHVAATDAQPKRFVS